MKYTPGCYYVATLMDEATIINMRGLVPSMASNGENIRYLNRLKNHADEKILVKFQEGNIFKFNNVTILEQWLYNIERIHITSGDIDG